MTSSLFWWKNKNCRENIFDIVEHKKNIKMQKKVKQTSLDWSTIQLAVATSSSRLVALTDSPPSPRLSAAARLCVRPIWKWKKTATSACTELTRRQSMIEQQQIEFRFTMFFFHQFHRHFRPVNNNIFSPLAHSELREQLARGERERDWDWTT